MIRSSVANEKTATQEIGISHVAVIIEVAL